MENYEDKNERTPAEHWRGNGARSRTKTRFHVFMFFHVFTRFPFPFFKMKVSNNKLCSMCNVLFGSLSLDEDLQKSHEHLMKWC